MTNGQGIRAGRFENQKEDYNENHSRTKSNDSCTGLIRSLDLCIISQYRII